MNSNENHSSINQHASEKKISYTRQRRPKIQKMPHHTISYKNLITPIFNAQTTKNPHRNNPKLPSSPTKTDPPTPRHPHRPPPKHKRQSPLTPEPPQEQTATSRKPEFATWPQSLLHSVHLAHPGRRPVVEPDKKANGPKKPPFQRTCLSQREPEDVRVCERNQDRDSQE